MLPGLRRKTALVPSAVSDICSSPLEPLKRTRHDRVVGRIALATERINHFTGRRYLPEVHHVAIIRIAMEPRLWPRGEERDDLPLQLRQTANNILHGNIISRLLA